MQPLRKAAQLPLPYTEGQQPAIVNLAVTAARQPGIAEASPTVTVDGNIVPAAAGLPEAGEIAAETALGPPVAVEAYIPDLEEGLVAPEGRRSEVAEMARLAVVEGAFL